MVHREQKCLYTGAEITSRSALHKRKVLTERTSPLTSSETNVMHQLLLTSDAHADVMLICWSRGMLR